MSNQMTPAEKNQAVAECLGWQDVSVEVTCDDACTFCYGRNPKTDEYDVTPDFCEDLNAMHEAEETLTEEERDAYGRELLTQAGFSKTTWLAHGVQFYRLANLSAEQRVDAFLIAKGIMTETGERV